MARAGKLDNFNEQETLLSRQYLAEAIEGVLKTKLKLADDRRGLVNPLSGATYDTALVGKPDPQLGMVRVRLAARGESRHFRVIHWNP